MSWEDLLATAAAQRGYFTSAQATEHGISRRALTWRAEHGSAERIGGSVVYCPCQLPIEASSRGSEPGSIVCGRAGRTTRPFASWRVPIDR